MPHRTAATAASTQRAFTLLELMVVCGILAVLLGVGVGFLGRGAGTAEAVSAIAGQLRTAALHARSTGLPTEVVLAPGVDGGNAEVRARGLQPIAVWSFEPDQRQLDSVLQPTVGGTEIAQGRFGVARAPAEGDQHPVLQVELPPSSVDLSDGFALRFDLKLESHRAGLLVRIARALEVQLDSDGRPQLRMQARTGTGTAVNLDGKEPLPVGRWCTFEVAADGHAAWFAVDGRVVDRVQWGGALAQQQGDRLDLGPSEQPVDGAFDEVQLLAYVLADPMQLPSGVQPPALLRIAFDTDGNPIAPPKIELRIEREDRTETLLVGQGGVLQ